jgi:hypothetical protein
MTIPKRDYPSASGKQKRPAWQLALHDKLVFWSENEAARKRARLGKYETFQEKLGRAGNSGTNSLAPSVRWRLHRPFQSGIGLHLHAKAAKRKLKGYCSCSFSLGLRK